MSRPVFYATNDSLVLSVGGYPQAGIPVRVWTRSTGGTQVTDLVYVAADGTLGAAVPSGVLTSNANGLIPAFAGPDGGPTTLWGDHGMTGERLALTADPTGAVGSSGASLTPTAVKTSAYTAAVADLVRGNTTSAGFTVTAPASPTIGQTFGAIKTDATANVLTVVATGKTINGDANATIITQWAGATFVYDGANWLVLSVMSAAGGGTPVTVDADGSFVVDGVTIEVGTDAEIAAAIAAAAAATLASAQASGAQRSANLSDVANTNTSRNNLGAEQGLTPTVVKTANYTAAAGDLVPVDTTSGAVTVTLPTAPANLTRIGVKHITQGGTNTVTVALGGSDVLNKAGGATSGTLTLLSQSAIYQYQTSGAIWTVTSADLPLSQLDLRFVPTSAASVPLSGPGIDLTGVTDSYAAVQALITANPGRSFRGGDGATYKMSNRLTIYTGQKLFLAGSTWSWVGWAGEQIVNSSAITALRTVTDCVTTASSATITSATAAFTSADIGRAVTVANAGPGTYNLCANIASVTNSTTAVLDTTATASTTAKALNIYVRDLDISITGGVITRDATVSTANGIMIRRADRVTVTGQKITNLSGLYNVNFGHCTNFIARDMVFDSPRDGVHVNGPGRYGLIENISGSTGDDVVSLTGHDAAGGIYGTYYVETCGDIRDVRINGIHKKAPAANGSAVRVLAGQQCKIRNVFINDVSGTSTLPMVTVSDLTSTTTLTGNDADGIYISNVSGILATANTALVEVGGPSVGTVVISGICSFEGVGTGIAVSVSARATNSTLHLALNNLVMRNAGPVTGLALLATSTWKSIVVSNARMELVSGAGGGAAIYIASASGPIQVTNFRVDGGSAAVYIDTTTGTVPLQINNLYIAGAQAGIWQASACTLRALVVGVNGDTFAVNKLFHLSHASAVLDAVVEGSRLATTIVSKTASQTVRINGITAQADLSLLTPTDGDVVNNSNGALACSTGPAIFHTGGTGVGWKNLYSGTTY